jgi:preprotein translocase subunit SecE
MSFIDYLKSTKGELKHVNWPTRREAIVYTVVVIAISVSIGAYLGALDFIFASIIKTFFI